MSYDYISKHGAKKKISWLLDIREKANRIYGSNVLLRVNQALFTASASLKRFGVDDLVSLLITSRAAVFFSDGMNK